MDERDARQVAEAVWRALQAGDWDAASGYLREDFVQEWPQSGERIVGRQNVIAVNEHYEEATGSKPSIELRRLVPPGEAWIVEATIDYGDGTPVSLVSILEADDAGQITRATDYFANPFEAPEWRAQWTERIK